MFLPIHLISIARLFPVIIQAVNNVRPTSVTSQSRPYRTARDYKIKPQIAGWITSGAQFPVLQDPDQIDEHGSAADRSS